MLLNFFKRFAKENYSLSESSETFFSLALIYLIIFLLFKCIYFFLKTLSSNFLSFLSTKSINIIAKQVHLDPTPGIHLL